MSDRNWNKVPIKSIEEFDKQFIEADVEIGTDLYTEPDYYYFARYSQKCPRGCCYDSVVECQTKQQRISELTEEIKDLVWERNNL